LKLLERILGKFRKREEVTEYSLEELDDILRDDCSHREKEAYKEAMPALKDVYSSFDNIRRIAMEINELKCPKEVNPRIKTVIRTAKPEFVREVLEALKERKEGIREDLEVEKTDIGETMETLAKAVMGPGKYLHMAYAEDIDKIRKELKNLAVKKKELEQTFAGDTATEDLIEEIKYFKERLIHKNLLEKERGVTEKKLKELEKEKISLEQENMNIEGGSEYVGYLEKKDLIQKIKCEKEEKENLVYNLLTPLKRPLKILRKSLEETKGTDASLKEIERYADDPVNSFCSQESKEFMKQLTSLKNIIDDNLDIKAEEKSRITQRISAIEGTDLERIHKEIIALRKHASELSIEISCAHIQKKKTANEKELDRARRQVFTARDELTRISKKIERDDEEMELKKQDLEENAGRLKNRRISIRLPGSRD